MQFTHFADSSRNDGKTAKLVVVAALHVALGAVFVHSINSKTAGWAQLAYVWKLD